MILASAGLGPSSSRAIRAFGEAAGAKASGKFTCWTGDAIAIAPPLPAEFSPNAAPDAQFTLGVAGGHLSLAADDDPETQVLALALCGRIENFRALKRRLIAAGKSRPIASESDVVRDLLVLYLARGRDAPQALRCTLALLVGDVAIAALLHDGDDAFIAAADRGASALYVGAGDNECALATAPSLIAGAGFASSSRAGDSDCVLLRPTRLGFVDEDDMIIERRLSPLAQVSARDDAAISSTVFV
ncbi:hypothetical protein [Terricaulis sp.]|uniref:hypothetical protein n=1 Tax=Terricaulis sp. TaxID=2768686 RepID=UPI002AC4894B|nr:hypothetical protein [Terricaulis sp.]MDZ4690004.1 hypothetical protein [Terricaulis sp.]